MFITFFIIFSGFLSAALLFMNARSIGEDKDTKKIQDFKIKILPYSIIIPARNEEKNIYRILDSINRQSIKPLEILVVDDFSTDKTVEIAKSYEVKLINPETLPKGWAGKNWACFTGALKAKGNILVFVDADVELVDEAIEKILLKCIKEDAVVSVQPFHKINKFYENISVFFNMISFAGINSFTLAGRLFHPKGIYGPVMALSAEKYFRSGGHRSVKGHVLEDMEIGKKFVEKGYKVLNYGGKGSIDFRMYPERFNDLIEGWSKNFASGASGIPW